MLAALVFLVALCARLIPLGFSELPYGIDGFPLVRIAEIMVGTGSIPAPDGYSGLMAYNMKLPVFSELLAIFSLVLGIEPMQMLPYFCALMGSLSVLFVFALTRRLTENDLAAFGAGMFAALTGLFVYVTTAAMKELVGITILCFILYLYPRRDDWRFRSAMAVSVALLPFTHHLTSLIALLILSFALVGTAFRRAHPHVRTVKGVLLDAATGPCILVASLAYYRAVNLEMVSAVLNANDIVLLASVAILCAVLVRVLSVTAQTRPWFFLRGGEGGEITFWNILDEKVVFFLLCVAALYLNTRVHLFAGSRNTPELLFRMMLPYIMLAVIGLIGFNVLRYAKFPRRNLIVGMFMAPLALMLFAVVRDLDVFGAMVASRSYNFVDIPLAITAGVGLAYIAASLSRHAKAHSFFRPLPAFAVAIFLLLCAMSLPLAYGGQEAFGSQTVTGDHEMRAMNWTAAHTSCEITTDQRIADIMDPYFGTLSDRTGPWKIKAGALENNSALLIPDTWTGVGAQMHPLENMVFSAEQMAGFLDDCNVVYSGGPRGNKMTVALYVI